MIMTTNATPKTKETKQDATAMLMSDHKEVKALFKEFEKADSKQKKAELVGKICAELEVHMQIEEEIFYPAVKAALKDHELVPEGEVEHASVKELIAQVKGVKPDGETYDARVKVMGEMIEHHVKEEETEMFPKAKKTKLDMEALGAKMAQRKEELSAKV
jgi:hemerythrin superfamily protein